MTDHPARILIVEDEAVVAMELKFILQDLGHTVVASVATSAEALAAAEAHRPDLALVDIHLSDGPTGIEVGASLAKRGDTGVLFMTANPEMLGQGLAGVVGVLSKPTDESTVYRAVDYALRRLHGQPAVPPRELRLLG